MIRNNGLKRILLHIYASMTPNIRKLLFSSYSGFMKIICPIIIKKLNKGKFKDTKIKEINKISHAVDFVYNFQYLGFSMKIAQIRYEIIEFLKIIKNHKLEILMEIGSAAGGTLFLFSKISKLNTKIISVDLPKGSFGGGYSKWKIPIFKSFTKNGQKIKLFRANSHDPSTYDMVKNYLNGRMLDLLFIDGDHTYIGVKKDFEMYSKLVKKGGIIAFHDIIEAPSCNDCEVGKFWNEIKNNYKFQEIIKDKNQNWAGIGVIYF